MKGNDLLRLRILLPRKSDVHGENVFGLQPENVLTMNISLPRQKYSQPEQVIAFHRQLLEQVEAVPGVANAGTITALPYGGATNGFGYTIDSPVAGDQAVSIVSQQASPELFRTLGIPLMTGRAFTEQDVDGAMAVVI